ncbi:MAG: biotin/lipoyl-binding protein [Candidatus Levyibacteriota bacterium]
MKNNNLKAYYRKTTTFIKSRPLGSFFIVLGLLLLVILIGHFLNQPKAQKQAVVPTKSVKLYSIGASPKASFQAKIEKAGVVKIIAQTSGIVQGITVTEGSQVLKGRELITLSTNYQGGNALGIQASIAQNQYQNVVDTFGKQKDAIQKQKDIANITHDNFTDQQAIASASANDTSSLISSNATILNTLNQQLTNDRNNGVSTATASAEQGQINTLQGAQNQLTASLRSLQAQTDSGKPTGRLADAQRDLTNEQLDIQDKALELNKEVSGLQAALAQVSADTMLPATPVSGTVERVFVRVGQQVSPGTELATITASDDADDPQTIAVVDVPQQIAQNISKLENSDIHLAHSDIHLKPYFVSADATDGLLYSIFYTIPTDDAKLVTDGQYLNVNIPIGSVNTGSTVPFIPIDAVYQTQDANYLLLDKNNKAVSQKVTLGNVFGNFIEVSNGLHSGDQVILDRNVVEGDSVKTQ